MFGERRRNFILPCLNVTIPIPISSLPISILIRN